MPWISTNLAASLGGLTKSATAAINDVQKSLNKLNNQVSLITSKVNGALSTVSAAKATLDKLTESGFYMINLSPQPGSWSTRLSSAPNAPPNLGYCCGTALIIVAPDLSAISDAYGNVVASIKKPMTEASNIVNKLDFDGFTPDETPSGFDELDEEEAKDWSDIFESDVWTSATLGDVFGGHMEGITKAANKLSKEAKSVFAGCNQASRSAFAISKGLNSAKNMMTKMQSTGVYNIILNPASGNYLQRLQSETGAPPSSSDLYTAGYVCITVAPNVMSLATKFQTLSKIVSGV